MQTPNSQNVGWAALLLIWGCQGPSKPIDSVPSTLPSPSSGMPNASPSPSPNPTTSPEPSDATKPQPTPIQQVEVVDITPPEFVQAGGKFLTLAVDDHPTDPTVFVEYSGGENMAAGLWKFKAGRPPILLLQTHELRRPFDNEYLLNYLDMKYSDGALYLNTPDANTVCLKKIPVDASLDKLPRPIACQPTSQPSKWTVAIALDQTGTIFAFTDKYPSSCSAALDFFKIKNQETTPLFSSQPIGPNKNFSFISHLPDSIKCIGLHHARFLSSPEDTRKWLDRSTNITYELPGMRLGFSATIQLPTGLLPQDVPADMPQEIPWITDGPIDKATFWLPFFSYSLDVDRYQNLYIHDQVAKEDYIRKITPEGHTTTLVSTSNPDFSPFKLGEINIHTKTGEDEYYVSPFVIDQQRDFLYVEGRKLYQIDLRSNQLKIIFKPSVGSHTLRVGRDGNLYQYSFTYPSTHKINKILIPQAYMREE